MNKIQQMVIHPVAGGQIIIHRLGQGFHVMLDTPEGVVKMPIDWVNHNRVQLYRICHRMDQMIQRHGQPVSLGKMIGPFLVIDDPWPLEGPENYG